MTINRAVQRLHALLARAVEWKVLERHPFSGLKPLRRDMSGGVRYLTADEETQLREALLGRETRLREARDRFNSWRAARGRQALPRRQFFRSRRASAARAFPGSDGEGLQRIAKAWRSLIQIAGIENFRFHDLRHRFASRLGHADITMVLRYAHMSPDRLAIAVERVVRAAEPAPNPPTPQPPGSVATGASLTPP